MFNGRFQILLRRRQNTYEGNNVVVQCNSVTGYSEYVPGNVDNATPFNGITPDAGWYDLTDYIENAEKLSLTWDRVNSGNSSNSQTNQDGSNYDKGVSSDLMFFDSAFYFIKDWLLTSECQILNAVEVKIIDLVAHGTYRIFEIKNDNIDYAPIDEPCQFHIKLREQDGAWHCIHKTFIWDDWQGWFKQGLKEHPCFLTCIEPRPRLAQSARMALMLFYHSNPQVALMYFIANRTIKQDTREILNANRFVDAPLVRTYIENVAGKCGLAWDTIFDTGQPFQYVCLYYPQAGYMHENSGASVASPSLAYHFDNRWLITIAELFDKLKTVFAAEWYVTPNNTIVFKHTKDLIDLLPIYDFTLPGSATIYDLRYTFNGEKKPAYGRYQYTDDGSDMASQEMSTLYSDIIDYDGPANNAMLEGEKSKNFEFAPTGFVRDGRSKDYMELLIKDGRLGALILLGIISVVFFIEAAGAPFSVGSIAAALGAIAAWAGLIFAKADNMLEYFVEGPIYTGAVRLTSEQTMTPRLIIWDGNSKVQARAVVSGLPSPNFYYNPDGINYTTKNSIQQDNPLNAVYNYPMYFDGDFEGNMFQYHDEIDNPLKSKESHQDVKFNVDLCEDMLNLFGVFQNQYAVIGKIVKLEERDNYSVFARISNIAVEYDSNKINIKGKVLRRA